MVADNSLADGPRRVPNDLTGTWETRAGVEPILAHERIALIRCPRQPARERGTVLDWA
jgi:hypothetical protein